MDEERSVTIPIRPWFRDHSFRGQTVLAAVETLIILAAAARRFQRATDAASMRRARFAKFLQIPQDAEHLEAMVDCRRQKDEIKARLLSRKQIKTMRRTIEHGEVCFAVTGSAAKQEIYHDPAPPALVRQHLDSGHVYRHLVPFGPAYRSLQQTVLLTDREVWARLRAGGHPLTDPVQEHVGSPFPFDGAMHAACVLGQQFVDYPPFPVGFAERIIHQPTRPGGDYIVRASLRELGEEQLLFDLVILDSEGLVMERVAGLSMRDVRRGISRKNGG